LLFYNHLYWSVYSVFQKAIFSALHGLTFQKILILQCFYLGMSNFIPEKQSPLSDIDVMK
jgi:hypothetical protein